MGWLKQSGSKIPALMNDWPMNAPDTPQAAHPPPVVSQSAV